MSTDPSFSSANGGGAGPSNDASRHAPRGPRSQRPHNSHLPLQSQPGGGAKANLKRIRDLKRILNKGDIPATVRADLEQEMQALHERRGEKKVKARRADMISRYHMVRFFERKKAMRKLKQAQKALETAEDKDEKARLKQEIHMAEVDIAYTQYFPHLEPYVSLWPNNKDPANQPKKKKQQQDADAMDEDDEAQEQQQQPADGTKKRLGEDPLSKPEMWHTIEQTMLEGTAALEKIRDRKNSAAFLQRPLVVHGSRAALPPQDKSFDKAKSKDKREKPRRNEVQRTGHWQTAPAEEEEDDGEGFFE